MYNYISSLKVERNHPISRDPMGVNHPTYTYIQIYMYVHIYNYTCIYIYICVYIYIYTLIPRPEFIGFSMGVTPQIQVSPSETPGTNGKIHVQSRRLAIWGAIGLVETFSSRLWCVFVMTWVWPRNPSSSSSSSSSSGNPGYLSNIIYTYIIVKINYIIYM